MSVLSFLCFSFSWYRNGKRTQYSAATKALELPDGSILLLAGALALPVSLVNSGVEHRHAGVMQAGVHGCVT